MNGSRLVIFTLVVSLLLPSAVAPAGGGFAAGTALAAQAEDESEPLAGGMGPLPGARDRADRPVIEMRRGQPQDDATALSGAANLANAPTPPPTDPREEACVESGNIWLPRSETCTHGPDPAPPGADAAQRPRPVSANRAGEIAAAAVCDGNGLSGPRVQVLYARASTTDNNYNQYLASIRTWADGADTIMQESAAEAGGSRRIRFVTTSSCEIDVGNVTVTPAGDDSFDNVVAELKTQGFTRTDRKYLVFLDTIWGGGICGVGGTYPDEGPAQANLNNYGPGFGVIQAGCWDDNTPAHELMHTLGAVQDGAPNSSRAGHCIDEYDVMCYPDAPETPAMRFDCPDEARDYRFDCNHDDYFHPNPPPGSYLAANWNAANNRFLVGGGDGPDDDGAPPTVTWTSPVGNDGVFEASTGTVPLEVTASDGSGINRVIFELFDASAETWEPFAVDRAPPFTADLAVADLRPGENLVGALAFDAVQDLAFEAITIERTEQGGGEPIDPPTTAIQLTRARGIAFDNAAQPNLWITSDATFNALLTKFSPSGARTDFAYGNIGSAQQIGQLAMDPGTPFLWMVAQTGDLMFVDTANPSGWLPIGSIPATTVDTSAMYDVATGRVHNGNGVIAPAISSYGDIALLKRATTFDAFVTGESQGFPFVVRLRWSMPSLAFQSAKVVAYSSQRTPVRTSRGIAVNAAGMVVTALPRVLSVPEAADAGLFFHADFPEGGGPPPIFLDSRLGAFNATGMASDASGRFYIPALTSVCGGTIDALIVLNPTFTGGVCYPLPEPGNNMTDIAVNAAGTLAYVTSLGSGKVWRYTLPAAPADSSPPTTPVLTLTEAGGNDPDQHVNGSTFYYNPGAGKSGSVQVGAVTSDPDSGIASVAFPMVFGGDGATDATSPYTHTYAWSTGANASGAKTVTATNGAELTSSASFTVTPDAAPPSASLTAPAAGAIITNGATVSANASDAVAGVARVEFRYCPGPSCTFAAGTAIGSDQSAPFSVTWTSQPADGSYTLLARATDHVGNVVDASPHTVTVRNTPVDATAPTTPILMLTESEPDEHAAGATLYYNPSPGNNGTFTVAAVSDDPESGIASVAFPAVFGGDAATDAADPYETTYAWSAGANASGARTVTATNGDGLTSSATFVVTPDTQGPSVSLTSPNGGATIADGATISATASDGLSGVARVEFRFCSGATCSFAAGTTIGTVSSAPFDVVWSNQPPDGDYTLVARAIDHVGNAGDTAGRSVTVRNTPLDTTPPTTPELTLTETEPDQHRAGTTLYYNPSPGNSGTFTVAASTSDPESGVAAVDFPAVFGADAASDADDPYEWSYTWSAGANASGSKTVSARNGAGLTSSSTFSVTPDASPPTVAITAPSAGAAVASGAVISVDAADPLSGVAQVEIRYCRGASCAFADGVPIGSAHSAPYAVTWAAQPPDGIYTLVARASDHVGNSADAAPRTVSVANDTTPPTAPTLTITANGNDQHVAGTRLYYNPSPGNSGAFTVRAESSDPQSGVASVTFPAIFGNDGSVDDAAPFERTYAWDASDSSSGDRAVTVRNGAGLTSQASFTVTPDTGRPTLAITAPNAGATVAPDAVIQVDAGDGAGVAEVEVRVCPGASCSFANGEPIGSDDAAPYAVTWSAQPAAGSYTLVARATDHVGNTQDASPVTVRVGNRAPSNVSAGGPYTVDEGGSVLVTGAATDPDDDPLIFGWDLDANGEVETLGQSATFSAAGRDGPANRQIGFAVCDNLGACAAAVGNVAIRNVAPSITGVSNTGPVAPGVPATVTVAATDPGGAGDPLTYEFDCQSDGQFEIGPQASPSAPCAFSSGGSRTVAVRLRDGDGGTATGATTVTVRSTELSVSCAASESQSASVAQAACDGRLDTVWASKPNPIKKKGKKKKKPKPETASVTFDLGAPGNDGPHAVGEIRWQFSSGCCDAIKVEVSTNGATYQAIATLPGRPETNTWHSLLGPSQPIQKVRLVMSAKKARQVGFLREVEFCAERCAGASDREARDGANTDPTEDPISAEPEMTAPEAPLPGESAPSSDTDGADSHAPSETGAEPAPATEEASAVSSAPDSGDPAREGSPPNAGGKKRGDSMRNTSAGKDDRDGDADRKPRAKDDHDKRKPGAKGGKDSKHSTKQKSHRQGDDRRAAPTLPQRDDPPQPDVPAQTAAAQVSDASAPEPDPASDAEQG
jgi:hypothetical protein